MKYFDFSSANGGSDSPEPTPQIPSVLRLPGDPRISVKPVLLGAPIAVPHADAPTSA